VHANNGPKPSKKGWDGRGCLGWTPQALLDLFFLSSRTVQLCKLQTLTVCNDVFFIWSEAQFGTINGLRLGTLQGQAVLQQTFETCSSALCSCLTLVFVFVCNEGGLGGT
jgi:hypothetical protein